MPVLYLIDGHAVAYRQFFGLPVDAFSTRDGEPTNAVFGFTRLLLDILEKERPDYLAVSFDMGLSGRDELYGEYKGTRDKMPDELDIQMHRIMQLVEAFNIPVLQLDGYEADDVIGTATRLALAENAEVRIITGDRDLLQLLDSGVTVQLPSRGEADEVYDVARFVEKYGVQPNQWVDMKALMGDTSDNIPGVRGIGDKKAHKFLTEYGTLENLYEHLDEIKGADQKKLEEGRELAFISQELARIHLDVPINLHLPDCVAHEFNVNDVLGLFQELNFRQLRDRLIKMTTPETEEMFADDDFDGDDFGDEDFSPPARADHVMDTVIVRDEDTLHALIERLKAAEAIVFDVEATSADQMQADLVGICLAVDWQTGYYIPVGHDKGKQLSMRLVLDLLRGPFTDPNIPKIAHNASYDLVVMQRHGVDVTPITFDTMVAEWVIDPQSKNLGLKNLAYDRLKDENGKAIFMTPITDLIGTGKAQVTMAEVSIEKAAPYGAADAVMTYRLVDGLREGLRGLKLLDLYDSLEMPFIPVLATLECAGVVLDVKHLAEMSKQLDVDLRRLEERIFEMSGGYGEFNINSPKQLNDVLFGKLGLPTQGLRKTSHGYSTDVVAMEALQDHHPIVREILNYRELSKLKGTYVDALPLLINPHTGRVHTSYNQTGTSTGRVSSSNPNLQNIPIRTEVGRQVRRAFVAPEGSKLLGVDYSQVELRILAHISRDETLIDAFLQGQDIHAATAAAVYGIPIEKVTYEQRSFAKRVNFGLIYGMSSFRLARDSNLTLAEADAFVKTYFERLPRVQDYIRDTKAAARQPEGLVTLFGRRRIFPALIHGRGGRQVQAAEERMAINMPIQGTAADIIKKAMIDLHNELTARKLEAKMILQVHDELVLEVPEGEIEETRKLVVDVMENAYPLDPPLKANANIGQNWRDMGS
jgi:DNA polymerase I